MRKEADVELLVANFDDSITLADLTKLFRRFGEVRKIEMFNGRKQRYAVVEMHSRFADRAIADLDGNDWRGRRLVVTESPR